MHATPEFTLDRQGDALHISGRGDWLITTIDAVDKSFVKAVGKDRPARVSYDLTEVDSLDTSGAFILTQAIRDLECADYEVEGTDGQRKLIATTIEAQMGEPPRERRQLFDAFERLGKGVVRGWNETVSTLAFLGQTVVELGKLIVSPQRMRWKSVVAQMEEVGLDATPIIMLLSFFVGAVIAFMGATLLASFGAQTFMVDLVGVTVLREFGVLITAIILAGRSASSFTAQLGAMKMRQEIDAMTVIGLDAFRALVIPRTIACIIAAPILTFLAMMSGIFGGMLVAWLGPTDITPVLFFGRLNEVVTPNNFWVGIVKAPIFAAFIAIIGCRQGMAVAGNVNSLGSRTTASVVQSIFSVILLDALFAILFITIDV